MKRKYVAISIIFIMIALVGGMICLYENRGHPIGTPRISYSYTVTSIDTGVASGIFNVSQGMTQKLNLTLQLLDGYPSITVPIDDMNSLVYNTIVYDNNWDTYNWNHSLVQTSVFNYSFSQKQLTLQPNATSSTIITINWADNAPTGRYALDLNLGRFQFLTPPGEGYQSYGRAIWLGFVVSPKIPT
jgi:hypothetical protein